MGDLRTEGPDSRRRRRAAARDVEAAEVPAHLLPAGVSNHLLARALSTRNPPAGATLQRFFQYKGKQVPGEAKVPTIFKASPADVQMLADDKKNDYGPITDAKSVADAMVRYREKNTVVKALPALDQIYAGTGQSGPTMGSPSTMSNR